MPFRSGRVSFCRFKVNGDAPQSVDTAILATFSEYAFRESSIGAPEEIESGWVTGEHILDTQFSYEKNGFGVPGRQMMLFALRIDTNKVPADIKRAYKRINEQALLDASATGVLNKSERREASETAARQVHEDLAAGKFRKSKMVPLLWDLSGGILYCGGTTNTIVEQVCKQFRNCFTIDLTPLTSGALAGSILHDIGRGRDYEDLLPSPFTAPPADASSDLTEFEGSDDLSVPSVPWVGKSLDLKDFVGNEFLIWLWFNIETSEGMVSAGHNGSAREVGVLIDKHLDMECAWDTRGKQSLRATGPTRLPEAREALMHGKWPRKIGLVIADDGEGAYEFSLQGDRLDVSAAMLPPAQDAQSPREIVEDRLQKLIALSELIQDLYDAFIQVRSTPTWQTRREAISNWIRGRGSVPQLPSRTEELVVN